jgi:hypothetical protein
LSAKFPDPFLTRDILLLRYQMALVFESGRFEKVLWQQVSHLLKYTKSFYGTVITAACARQGCSATEKTPPATTGKVLYDYLKLIKQNN